MTNLPAEVSNAALYVAGACSVSPAGFFSAALSPACPANAVAAASSATAANIDLFMLSPLRFQISDFRLQTSDFRLQTSDFRLQTSDFRLQTSDFRLHILKS